MKSLSGQRDVSSVRKLASILNGPFLELGSVRQKSGKTVVAWAFAGDCDPLALVSNTCEVEWPPRSKKLVVIPEVDRGAWFSVGSGPVYVREEQRPFLLRLEQALASS